MKIKVRHAVRFDVRSRVERVFDLLADVPRSAGHFPGLDELVPLGGNSFRWEMAPITLINFSHQVVYACEYVNDTDSLGLAWSPVDGIGNSTIRGRWRLKTWTPEAGGEARTTVEFDTSGELDVPAPKLIRALVSPAVEHRFRTMVDQYHANLRVSLEG